MVLIREVLPSDWETWSGLRRALWPDCADVHSSEMAAHFGATGPDPTCVLLAFDRDGEAAGMIELALRPYAEGCAPGRVGYVEGWYVVPHARGRGIGRSLMQMGEDWVRRQGALEMASDADITNSDSHAARGAVGFCEVAMTSGP